MADLESTVSWALEVWGVARRYGLADPVATFVDGGARASWARGLKRADLSLDPEGDVVLELFEARPDGAWSSGQHVTPGPDGLREAVARVRDHVGPRAPGSFAAPSIAGLAPGGEA